MHSLKVKIGIGVLISFLTIFGFMVYQYQSKVDELKQQNWSLTAEIGKLQQKNEEGIADLTRLNSEIRKRDE
ncbi:hypothetical protein [Desulfitobacterium sp.]|uniref:hypothetical protein n=1 Tax=Desulfitobacterium sp. TaxID=49981 RepID=UPI002CD8DAF4|nr:hypothetical protein [Desulfitobacterium sp.]HVJ47993.1 hypothetical protein [Desulfitobacterium sp.]